MKMTSTKPWLAHYEAGVPAEINPDEYNSLAELLDQSFKQFAKRDMVAFMGAHWTYAQVDQMSQAIAAWLQAQGLAKGARVALMMPNIPQYAVAIAAVLRAGYVVVNVNPLYTPRELEHQLKDAGAEAIVILENFATTLQEVVARTPIKHIVLASMGDMLPFPKGALVNFVVRHVKKMVPAFSLPNTAQCKVITFKDVVAKGRSLTYNRPTLKPSDVAFLQYTGGTTGVSKGATLLHRNVVANILQNEAWFKPELDKLGNEPLVSVCALPLYHIFALTVCYFMGARTGSMSILIPNPRD
ncbi:MAG TPA: AMP-binding protein, partial [Aquabacterium sp.]|nr:AMP-binding protein [Aquabacterium sp.]